MTKRGQTAPDAVPEVSGPGAASPAPQATHAPPIEATLELPDDDTNTGKTKPSRDTVIINTNAMREQQAGGQYLVVRPERSVRAYLLVCMGANVGHRYPIGESEVVIGRSDRADIRIDDDRVSSRHAELVRRGERYRIYDLGSSNGTLVNAQRIDEIDLRDGDLIQVGYTVFRYVSGDALEPARPQPIQERPPEPQPVQQAQQQGGMGAAFGNGGLGAEVHARPRYDDDEVSFAEMVAQLRRLIAFFWPYRWIITGLGAAGLVLGIVSAFVMPPSVAAYFDVRLHNKASENPLEKFESNNVEFFRSAATTFRSTGLIAKTLQALGEQNPSAERLQALQSSLHFDNTGSDQNSQTYTGSYRGDTPDNSLAFLTKHVELYLGTEIDKTLKIIKAQVDFLQSQLDQTEKDLRETESKLLAFKKENIDGLPDQARQYYDYLFELQKKESDLESEINRLEAEAAVDARRLDTETPLVESRVLATRPYQQAIVDVNRQLAEARAKGLADDHPDVRQLKSKLEELKRLAQEAEKSTDDTEVERSRNPIYESTMDRLQRLRASSAATRGERERLRQDQARIKSIVDKLPKLEAEYAELTRSYDATKALHTRIFDQLKTAQLQYELEKASASARYEIITEPRLEYVSPVKTVTKRGGILMIAGLFFGFLFATVMQMKRLLAPPSQA
jgi:pSer/pThr/pTyr-binding forkhead associated (FHA) protein/uncharacterized protein involved in exopolysaccharide biosynthesis